MPTTSTRFVRRFHRGTPSSPRSRRVSRLRVGAWLIGVRSHDARVMAAAAAAGTVHCMQGSAPEVLRESVAANVRVIYCTHAQLAHTQFFAEAGISLFSVDALLPVAVAALAIPISTPLVTEQTNGTVCNFFLGEDGDHFQMEGVVDERSYFQRIWEWVKRVYLPVGYPDTVTKDYLAFTKYRTLQNLASAIMTVISTEALLFGLGLGKKVAAGVAATNWVLKDGASHLAKILYGSFAGSKFDMDPKAWRVAADITEDIGGALEILTPLFPGNFLLLASLANILKGVSGMTGTATRHVVYRSLAATGQQNIGDIATKGESQGVTLKMVGLGAGILISSRIGQNYYALLAAYWAFATVHLAANWRSMRCVQFSFFNKQRAAITISHSLRGLPLPDPYKVSHMERIVLPPWRGFEPFVRVGVSMRHAVSTNSELQSAVRLLGKERFLIVISPVGRINVLLKPDAQPSDALRAYFTVQTYLHTRKNKNLKRVGVDQEDDLKEAYHCMRRRIRRFVADAAKVGWDTDHVVINDGHTRVSW